MNKQKYLNKKPLWMTVLGILMVSVWAVWFIMVIYELMRPDSAPSAIQHYDIANLPARFQEVWVHNDGFDSGNYDGIVLEANGGVVFFLGDFTQFEPSGSLQKLNISTGEIELTIDVSSRSDIITANDEYVYVGVRSGQKIDSSTLNGAAQIIAYDAGSGKQVWSQRIRGARSIRYISTYASGVSVIGSTVAGERYQYLNGANGQVQYSDDANYPVFYTGDTWYMMQPPSRLRAAPDGNNSPLWERHFDTETFNYSRVNFAPVLDNGIITGRTGEGVGRVYALDSTTGQLLWWSEDVVYGNVVANRGVTFFLTEQAKLKAVNSRTGQALATVTFEPETPQERLAQGGRIYNVTVSDDIVVVYLGDSRQLFAFRFTR